MNFGRKAWRVPVEKILSKADVSKVLRTAKAEDPRDYLFLMISANTGLRISEVVHLKRSDLHSGQLEVIRRKKRGLDPETIDIPAPLWKLIQGFVNASKIKSDWLFPGHSKPCSRGQHEIVRERATGKAITTKRWTEKLCDGGHVSRREIQRRWEKYLGKCKLSMEGRGIHSLRHYAITDFYATYKDIRAAQMFAGHSSSFITESYAHVVDLKEKIQKRKMTL